MQLTIEIILLITSVLLFFSLVIGKVGHRFGVPTLLIFLFIGILAGSDGLGLQFNSPQIAQYIGVIALNIILFSGGMDTRLEEIKPIARQGLILATIGVLLTSLITGFFIYYLTNNLLHSISFSLIESMLLASVMSSTDSASVFSILRSKNIGLKENLRPLLELESGSNDPMAYLLTVVLIQMVQEPTFSFSEVIWMLIKQLAIGGLVGFFVGQFSVRIINTINLDNDALYAVLLVSVMFFIFGLTVFFGGNGYLAVYLGGLIIGNHKFVHRRSSMKFFNGMTWLVQILMFLTLGLLVNPSEMLPIAGIGILIGLFMILLSRPFTVQLCLLPFRKMSLQARNYVSWVGLRGAVPIIFATYPVVSGLPNSNTIFNIVFFITILSLLIQGTTVSKMADWLHLSLPTQQKPILKNFDVEFADEIKSSMSEISIKKEYLANGTRLMDLTIPDKTLIVMVKRDNQYFVPRGNTELLVEDKILVITDNESALNETYQSMKGSHKKRT